MIADSSPRTLPIVWTVAGSDSGGGAGIQADLRTFSFLGVFGCSVIAALTAQNPTEVKRAEAVSPEMISSQLQALWEVMPPKALKTGMLFTRTTIEKTGDFLRESSLTAVTDPVMVSTSGKALIEKEAAAAMRERLFPFVSLLTPNIPEGESLTGIKIRSRDEMLLCAEKCRKAYGCAILLKGGHLSEENVMQDIFLPGEGGKALVFSSPVISLPQYVSHGTGCTLSAAVTAFLARGFTLPESILKGKAFVLGALTESVKLREGLSAMFPPSRKLEEYEKMIQCREISL